MPDRLSEAAGPADRIDALRRKWRRWYTPTTLLNWWMLGCAPWLAVTPAAHAAPTTPAHFLSADAIKRCAPALASAPVAALRARATTVLAGPCREPARGLGGRGADCPVCQSTAAERRACVARLRAYRDGVQLQPLRPAAQPP